MPSAFEAFTSLMTGKRKTIISRFTEKGGADKEWSPLCFLESRSQVWYTGNTEQAIFFRWKKI